VKPTPEQREKIRQAAEPAPAAQRRQAQGRVLGRLGSILAGRRATRDYAWPGQPDVAFKMRPMTHAEVQECRAAAEARLAEVGVDLGRLHNADVLEDEQMVQALAIVMRDPDDPSAPFTTADDLRSGTTIDEQRLVMAWWGDLQAEANPFPDRCTQEELEAFVALAKKGDAATLIGFGSPRLAAFAITLASPPASSPTPSSSGG
jgi:hypothetical protein